MALLNFQAPCPYCYVRIDVRKVDFRCLGLPAAGRSACEKSVDEVRRQHFNDLEGYYPAFTPAQSARRELRQSACPACLGSTGVRLCPQCHSRLPDEFSGDSPLIGLVGARSAGKTVMLAVLMRELATNGPVANRFDHAIGLYGGGEVNGEARRLQALLAQMEADAGGLPEQTQRAGAARSNPIVFEWKYQRQGVGRMLGDNRSTIFSFYDTAGEDLATEQRAQSMTYLLAAGGIILLLDPFAFPANVGRGSAARAQRVETAPENVLGAVTAVLRANGKVRHGRKIQLPLAVCISKIDAFLGDFPQGSPVREPSSKLPYFDEAEAKEVHEHMGGMVSSWGGGGLLNMLDTEYANYRLFGLSALGSEPDYESQRVDARGIAPHRVTEPLLWLLAQRGFIPRKG